jgi:hypothetical protein
MITDGASRADLLARGDQAVWSALVRTAGSALQHGWTFPEWAALVSEPSRNLGRQAQTRHRGSKVTQLTGPQYERKIAKAWDAARSWLAKEAAPATTPEDLAATITAIRLLVEDADADLTASERAILAYAANEAERLNTTRPALPRKTMLQAASLGLTAARTALRLLDRKGLLVLEVHGRPAGANAKAERRRSNCYRLPIPGTPGAPSYLYRGTRSVVPRTHLCGAPASPTRGAPSISVVPPESSPDPSQEESVITVTVSARDADTLRAQLAELLAGTDVRIQTSPPPDLTVLPGGKVTKTPPDDKATA